MQHRKKTFEYGTQIFQSFRSPTSSPLGQLRFYNLAKIWLELNLVIIVTQNPKFSIYIPTNTAGRRLRSDCRVCVYLLFLSLFNHLFYIFIELFLADDLLTNLYVFVTSSNGENESKHQLLHRLLMIQQLTARHSLSSVTRLSLAVVWISPYSKKKKVMVMIRLVLRTRMKIGRYQQPNNT
jgi:hypothetical protein